MMTPRRFAGRVTSLAALALTVPSALAAQDRLIGTGAAGAGLTVETVRFGGDGFRQPSLVGGDSVKLRSIRQYSVPLTVAIPLGTSWTVDLQSAWASSEITFDDRTGAKRTASLSGPTDVRLRATGRLFNDGVVLTAGVNAPSGKTELTVRELTALRAVAAPALGLGAPPVGAGPSGTMGMVLARQVGGWAVALGGSYELRGTYQPVAAITAGSPSTDFQPGNVVRGSLGLDRLVGANRLSITAAADFYSDDVLQAPGASTRIATIKLGPIYTTDVQLQVAAPRVKELAFWVSNRFRTNYTRDGNEVDGTSGVYVDGGVRTSVPLSSVTDLFITGDGRYHSGLEINQGIATAGVVSAGATLGLSHTAGSFSLQPYFRAQAGSLRPRTSGTASSTSFVGGSAGLVIVTRF
ncbi:hypothetical protein [Gemmatimonas phototrophica]|nr:hypothetical protein [Gemmatimonas phototrophica]